MKEDGEPLSQVIAIFSERGDHTWALTKKGDIYCWGSNKRGQLGGSKLKIGGYSPYATKVDTLELTGKTVLDIGVGGGEREPFSL